MRQRARTQRSAHDTRRPLAADDGIFLVEVLMASVLVLIVGAGVAVVLNRSSQLTGQERVQAIAGNVAQSEQESLRAYTINDLSNLRRNTTQTVAGIPFTVVSRADWLTDRSGDPDCASGQATADYLELTTTVTWPAMGDRAAVTLVSIASPPARAFADTQGSLAVSVRDRLGAGIPGVTLNLSGASTQTDATNSSGCVLWGYLPAGNGYAIAFAKAGYVDPTGTAAVSTPISVIGATTSNVDFLYDRAGTLQADFVTTRPGGAQQPTSPQTATLETDQGGGIVRPSAFAGTRLTVANVFPFTTAYSVYADSCTIARPPAGANRTSAMVAPAAQANAVVALPALNVKVTSKGVAQSGASVKVTTACGNVIARTTDATGLLADPGFPYAPATNGLVVCVSAAGRKHQISGQANTSFAGTNLTLGVGTGLGSDLNDVGSTTGTC